MILLQSFISYTVFVISVLNAVLHLAHCQTVIACGGFVKGPESIDFSKIEVRLFTADGILKYQSYCAPHNGYFTVPVYNNGDYVLKLLPPSGWTFNPPQVPLKIDGKTDPCTKAEDINFSFAGFQVTGKVVSIGSDVGPEGLRMELHPEGGGSAIKTTTTGFNGGYSFDGVDPGKYTLIARHLTWRFKENKIPVVVTKAATVAQQIQVTGYDLTGSVMSDNGPIADVQLTLYAPEKNTAVMAECTADLSKVTAIPGFKAICGVKSEASGVFSFVPLPPGSYKLVPSFNNGRTRFSVVPATLDVTISNSSVTIKEPFVVSGFSISGRLLYPSGYPANGIKVLIGGKAVATTGEDGVYIVEEIKSGTLKVKYSAEHAEFPDLSSSVSPDHAVLPDVSANKLAACGQVVGESTEVDNVEVVARNTKSGSVNKLNVTPKKSRSFCFMLEPGEYNIGVENPVAMYRPRTLAVSLKAGPHFGVSFEAFIASASGRVACLEKDCMGILITLFQQNEHNQLSPVAELKTLKAGDFVFRNLHPGKFVLKASKAPYCFGPTEGLAFTIEDKDVTDLKIVHAGYSLAVTASHPIRLNFKLQGEQKDKKEVTASVEVRPPKIPSATVCLPQPGRYSVVHERFPERNSEWGCHFFSGSYPTEVDTANLPNEINAVALLHLVTITVQSAVQIPIDELYVGIRYIENTTLSNKISGKSDDPLADIPPNFVHLFEAEIAEYHKQKALRQPITTPLKRRDRLYFGEEQVRKNDNGTYSYDSAIFWYATQIGLEPKHPRLIFKPKTVEFTLEQDAVECPAFAAFFTGVEASVLKGFITPPTAGVRVTLTNRKNPEEVHVIWTEQDGTYSLGPLDPGDQYDAEASIEGWEILPAANQPGNFTARRLGSIDMGVTDESGIPLEGVLISISGPGHFRNNSLTGKDGMIHIGSLAGGQYYAQAFRKEFAFEPPNKLIELKSGEASTIKFSGKRVAHSCFGKVVSLNSEPEQGLFVVARPLNCDNAPGEEAETDAEGNFRILGLFPHCSYSVTLRNHPLVERTVPAHVTVNVHESDVKGVKLWAVRSPLQQLLITVRLDGPAEFLNAIQLVLMNSTTGATLHVLTPSSSMVAFPPLPSQSASSSYALRIEPLTNFAAAIYALKTDAVEVQLDESGFVHAVVKYEVIRRSEMVDHDSPIAAFVQGRSVMSVLVSAMVIIVIGGVYFYVSAEKSSKQAAAEAFRAFLANPSDFVTSRFKSREASGREISPEVVRKTTNPGRQAQSKPAVSAGEKTVSDVPVTNVGGSGGQFGLRRSSSSSSLSSTSSSSPSPSRPAAEAPAAEQPRKRGPMRSRLQ